MNQELLFTPDQQAVLQTLISMDFLPVMLPLFIYGERCSGKTTILYEIAKNTDAKFISYPNEKRKLSFLWGLSKDQVLIIDEISPSSMPIEEILELKRISRHRRVIISGTYCSPNMLASWGPMVTVGLRRLDQ